MMLRDVARKRDGVESRAAHCGICQQLGKSDFSLIVAFSEASIFEHWQHQSTVATLIEGRLFERCGDRGGGRERARTAKGNGADPLNCPGNTAPRTRRRRKVKARKSKMLLSKAFQTARKGTKLAFKCPLYLSDKPVRAKIRPGNRLHHIRGFKGKGDGRRSSVERYREERGLGTDMYRSRKPEIAKSIRRRVCDRLHNAGNRLGYGPSRDVVVVAETRADEHDLSSSDQIWQQVNKPALLGHARVDWSERAIIQPIGEAAGFQFLGKAKDRGRRAVGQVLRKWRGGQTEGLHC